jgi:hypothetical protein
MKINAWVKPAIWGGIAGAIAIMILGFSTFGWTTGGTAERMANARAEAAVVAALVPFCVASAQHDPDAANLAKFKAEDSAYNRTELVSKAGWATMPGMASPDRALASACSEKLRGPNA